VVIEIASIAKRQRLNCKQKTESSLVHRPLLNATTTTIQNKNMRGGEEEMKTALLEAVAHRGSGFYESAVLQ